MCGVKLQMVGEMKLDVSGLPSCLQIFKLEEACVLKHCGCPWLVNLAGISK